MTKQVAANDQKWSAARIAIFLRFAALAPIVAGCVYLLVYLPAAPAIAVIDATIQSVKFQVAVPDMAQIRLNGFALTYQPPSMGVDLGFQNKTIESPSSLKPLCFTGVLVPTPGTWITYKRFGTGPVSVKFERPDSKPAATFSLAEGDAPAEARQASWIRLEARSDDDATALNQAACPGESSKLLRIYGVADLGTELGPATTGDDQDSGILIEGRLDIFGKTLELGAISEGATRIYPASTASITLPPGSRITEYAQKGQARQPWAGFALVDADAHTALKVKVSTPASRLAIIRPGLGLKPEILSIGLFTQLIHDPMLVWAQIVVALVFSTLRMLSSVFALFSSWQEARLRMN